MYWPCSYQNHRGRCCNGKSGHSDKGHQISNGRLIAYGEYQSDFDPRLFKDEWFEMIRGELQNIEGDLDNMRNPSRPVTFLDLMSNLHLRIVRKFYNTVGDARHFFSHEACFSCLRELPEHAMPCGHILCNPCVMSFGQKITPVLVEMTRCPLHADTLFEPAWQVKIKPRYAGTRVLSLDG